MHYSNESSSVGSSSNESNHDLEDSGEDFDVEGDVNIIQPYAFEPVEETDSDDDVEEEMGEDESSSNSENATSRLADTNW